MNFASIKFFGLFMSALCRVQTVCFEKLICSFDSNGKADLSLHRIQRFISEHSLDSELVARFLFSLTPKEPPYRTDIVRVSKLLTLVLIAFAWVNKAGISETIILE
jgi:hypothetical protein